MLAYTHHTHTHTQTSQDKHKHTHKHTHTHTHTHSTQSTHSSHIAHKLYAYVHARIMSACVPWMYYCICFVFGVCAVCEAPIGVGWCGHAVFEAMVMGMRVAWCSSQCRMRVCICVCDMVEEEGLGGEVLRIQDLHYMVVFANNARYAARHCSNIGQHCLHGFVLLKFQTVT